jgi:hypothetical protein
VSSLTGTIGRGKKDAKELSFVDKGQGVYAASLSALDLGLGTYQCAVTATLSRLLDPHGNVGHAESTEN